MTGRFVDATESSRKGSGAGRDRFATGTAIPVTKAVLFDIDGTLIDSNDAHARAWVAALAEAGHEVPFERVENIRGHRLPLRRPGSPAASGRTLLVGDAAGLVDPLSGDGMYEAFLSSRLAADSILDLLEARTAGLEPYTTRLNRTLAPGASAAWGAKTVAARYPRLTFAIARLPLAWSAVDRLVRGDLEHPGEERGLGRVALKAVERIARAAGDPGAAYRAEAHAA